MLETPVWFKLQEMMGKENVIVNILQLTEQNYRHTAIQLEFEIQSFTPQSCFLTIRFVSIVLNSSNSSRRSSSLYHAEDFVVILFPKLEQTPERHLGRE